MKCLLLFSGGLDSCLAAIILKNLGFKVEGLYFKTYFFDERKALRMAKRIGIKLRVVDISKEHLEIVKNPKYGYGKGMNPCLDCKILMFKKAKEIMEREGFDFIATGEVLNERPFSQSRKAFKIIEEETSLKGLIVRPLSGRILPKTLIEEKGIIDRKKLYNIKGKRRKKQIELAKRFGLKEYPQPAGGCILTDPQFSKRLRMLLKACKNPVKSDIELLGSGRNFWRNSALIVVGRNEEENEKIKKLARKGDILIELENYPGPTTLIRAYGGSAKKHLEFAKQLTKRYSRKARNKNDVRFRIQEI